MAYTREDTVENYLVAQVKARGGIAYKFTSPGRMGVPDRICVFDLGWLFFVETKAPKGRLSPAQKREIKRLRDRGQRVYVPASRAEVDELLEFELT